MNMLFMSRLTEPVQDNIVEYKIRKGACAVDCVEKLGLYEDIGLLPEQVKQLKKDKEEREKGCTCCNDYTSLVEHLDKEEISLNKYPSGGYVVEYDNCGNVLEAEISYCPKCGKEL